MFRKFLCGFFGHRWYLRGGMMRVSQPHAISTADYACVHCELRRDQSPEDVAEGKRIQALCDYYSSQVKRMKKDKYGSWV